MIKKVKTLVVGCYILIVLLTASVYYLQHQVNNYELEVLRLQLLNEQLLIDRNEALKNQKKCLDFTTRHQLCRFYNYEPKFCKEKNEILRNK